MLSPRLQVIASKVPKNSKIADIGTDHAYIPIYLINKGLIKYAVASDVKIGPLERAKANVEKHGFKDQVDLRLGNGLQKIKLGEVDTVIVAGMGGILINDILTAGLPILSSVKNLILQPMIAQEKVRMWLEKNDFVITDEQLVKEDYKIYNIIVAKHGKEKIDREIYYYVGKRLIEKNDPLLEMLITRKIAELEKIINMLQKENSQNALSRRLWCKKMLDEYKKLKKECSKW